MRTFYQVLKVSTLEGVHCSVEIATIEKFIVYWFLLNSQICRKIVGKEADGDFLKVWYMYTTCP